MLDACAVFRHPVVAVCHVACRSLSPVIRLGGLGPARGEWSAEVRG